MKKIRNLPFCPTSKRRNKQGMELAMNTIIIAAIALLVLIVIVVVFTGGFGKIWESFTGVSTRTVGKADCVIIGVDDANDKDGDGYHDTNKYKVIFKNDEGKNEEVECMCDKNANNAAEHQDDTGTNQKKYC